MYRDPLWRFDPWNLDKDVALDGVRLLVVAESHYKEEEQTEDEFTRTYTQDIVRRHGLELHSSSAKSGLFFNIAKTLSSDPSAFAEVWNLIYFYNYFLRVMDQPSEKPMAADYHTSVAPFDAVLAHVRPDAVLITSRRLWRGMKNECDLIGECALGEVYALTAGRGLRIPVAHTHHPTRAYNPDRWRPLVQDFLTMVREKRL